MEIAKDSFSLVDSDVGADRDDTRRFSSWETTSGKTSLDERWRTTGGSASSFYRLTATARQIWQFSISLNKKKKK